MASVSLCDECNGLGAHGYETGPAVERCPRCGGAGILFGDPARALRDLAATLGGGHSTELESSLGEGGLLRALAVAVAALEERVSALERELAKPV